jgi:hypothetical protein
MSVILDHLIRPFPQSRRWAAQRTMDLLATFHEATPITPQVYQRTDIGRPITLRPFDATVCRLLAGSPFSPGHPYGAPGIERLRSSNSRTATVRRLRIGRKLKRNRNLDQPVYSKAQKKRYGIPSPPGFHCPTDVEKINPRRASL